MREIGGAQISTKEWSAWFVLLLGGFLIVATIVIAVPALSATTIWYVLVPGTAVGMLLTLIGALCIGVLRELAESSGTGSLGLFMVVGLALGLGMGSSIGAMLGFIALGVSFGSILGIAIGMAMWLVTRRLTRR